MTAIKQEDLIQSVADAFQYISYYHPLDYIKALGEAYDREESPAAKDAIAQILTNSRMSAEGHRPICQDTGIGMVFIKVGMQVTWPDATTTTQHMFDEGVMRFTGITSSPADALASLFPGLTKTSKIAIKPSLLNGTVPTRKELVKAVIVRLVQMLGGFPATNLTLHERHDMPSLGYTKAYFGQQVGILTDTAFPDLGYTILCDGKRRPYSKTLHDSDFLINMPVLKDHFCEMDFTLAFKNHMGTVNPGGPLGICSNKKAVLDEIVNRMALSALVTNFLHVLLGNTRMHHIAFVNKAYSAEVDRRTGVVKAQVTSASALSSEEQSTLTSKLETMTGKQVIVEFGTDADLIGGVVTRIGSRIYDGSVRAKLDAAAAGGAADHQKGRSEGQETASVHSHHRDCRPAAGRAWRNL